MVACYVYDKVFKYHYRIDKYDDFLSLLHTAYEHELQIDVMFIKDNVVLKRDVKSIDLYIMFNNQEMIHEINIIIHNQKIEVRVICKLRVVYVAELCSLNQKHINDK